jgi:hypothetical protein
MRLASRNATVSSSLLLNARLPRVTMQLDLTDEESSALQKLLVNAVEYDRYPLSPRVQMLRGILAKFGPMAPPPPPPARSPTPAAPLSIAAS